jgi:hypothetical protein
LDEVLAQHNLPTFCDFLIRTFRIIDAEKKSSENNEDQRRPRIMLALQQCVMSMQVLIPSNQFGASQNFLLRFCSILLPRGIIWYPSP